jgi:exodeoxyribonuclease VII large subunit
VILLVRGGGSIEDLWAFNDPEVVRAVAASPVPIICGVGHETDFTLSDFAADLRAPTPTAAAELATPVTPADLLERLRATSAKLVQSCHEMLKLRGNQVGEAAAELRYRSPERRIQIDRQHLDDLGHRLRVAQMHRLALQSSELDGWDNRLQSLNPLHVLDRGYAVVTNRADGTIIRSVRQARGQIHVRVSDGGFDADVSRPAR